MAAVTYTKIYTLFLSSYQKRETRSKRQETRSRLRWQVFHQVWTHREGILRINLWLILISSEKQRVNSVEINGQYIFFTTMKVLIFIMLALLLVHGQETQITDDQIEGSMGQSSDLPSNPATIGTRTALFSVSPPPTPANFNYVQQPQFPGRKWNYPNGNYQIYPRGSVYCYTIKFYTDCPINTVTLNVAATGLVFVQHEGNWLLSWGAAYPTTHQVKIKPKCGCNQIRVCVYNYYYASPLAMTYSLTTTLIACGNCRNEGVTFYNKRTCACQCAYSCPSGWTQEAYPACGCKCAKEVRCLSGRYFNQATCRCECNPKCCPKGYYLSPTSSTCTCQRFFITGNVVLQTAELARSGTVNLESTVEGGN